MKHIDTNRLKAEIKKKRNEIVEEALDPDASIERVASAKYKKDALSDAISIIDSLQQEQTKLTQVPRIEQETQKKGWMDYGLLISEIGLHRSSAIERIKETKERATEIKRNIAPHDLAILGEYLESVGAEIVLCCLQRYCMDFMFTQDEVKEIIQQEQPEVDLKKEIDRELDTRWKGEYLSTSKFRESARHFFNLGLNARKED